MKRLISLAFMLVSISASAAIITGAGTNATQLNGATFSAPGPIGDITPSTGAFTTSTATTYTGALSGNASTATTAGTVTTAAQPAITSVGTLTGLAVGNAVVTFGSDGRFGSLNSGADLVLGKATPTANGTSRLTFLNSNTVKNWNIGSNDNVSGALEFTPSTANGGGTFTTPTFKLLAGAATVTGTIAVSSSVSLPGLASSSSPTTGTLCWTTGGDVNVDTTVACLASTRKVKQAIKPLNIGLKQVMKMRPVSYDLKPEFNPEHLGRQVGLIAEEVSAIDNRLVAADDKGDPRGVRYMQLTAVLVKAIQEQQKQIKRLQHQIKTSNASR